MALRLVEAVMEKASAAAVPELLASRQLLGIWQDQLGEGQALVRVLLDSRRTEAVLDLLDARFGSSKGFRLMVFPIEATLPRCPSPDEPDLETGSAVQEEMAEDSTRGTAGRISREELFNDVTESAAIGRVYFVMTVLSTLVAAIGLIRDDVAVIIGAMVIAPLLGPNVALALATTLGDGKLARQALTANGLGLLTALVLSLLLGVAFDVDSDVPAIASRTEVGLDHVLLALASGIAGALAFTRGAPVALIGVMVAVALLPPLVVSGLLAASGDASGTLGAALLLSVNIICVNLAGVLTFLAQGIRPRNWWEAERAKRASRTALTIWLVLLVILTLLIFLSTRTPYLRAHQSGDRRRGVSGASVLQRPECRQSEHHGGLLVRPAQLLGIL